MNIQFFSFFYHANAVGGSRKDEEAIDWDQVSKTSDSASSAIDQESANDFDQSELSQSDFSEPKTKVTKVCIRIA